MHQYQKKIPTQDELTGKERMTAEIEKKNSSNRMRKTVKSKKEFMRWTKYKREKCKK